MTRAEELALQEKYLKAHPQIKSQKTVNYKPPTKKKNGKKHRQKKINKEYLKALRRNKRGLVTKITRPEQAFKDILDSLEIKYSFQRIFTVDKKGYIVDFYLVDYLMVIEIDGNNHNEIIQDKKDDERTESLLKLNKISHIIRFNNEDVLCMSVQDAKKELAIKICPFIEDLL